MFILGTIVLTLVMVNTVLIISNALTFSQSSKYSVDSLKASNLAEAGLDKALASLNKGGSYNDDGSIEHPYGDGTYTIAIGTNQDGSKNITAVGYIPNKASAKSKRTITVTLAKGAGFSFIYALQAGSGGLILNNNATVDGPVYSNYNVSMGNGAVINGDTYVAGGVQPTAEEQTECLPTPPSSNCKEFFQGGIINGSRQLDAAQSFKTNIPPPSDNVLSKISLKLKKVGNPGSDISVKLTTDKNGKPDKNGVLTTGVIYNSLVTSSYSWIDVEFASRPVLADQTTYWIVIDTSSYDPSNYWAWSANKDGTGYTRGKSYWSPDWSLANATWNDVGSDLDFKTFMGGVPTSITGGNINNGDAHANTINNTKISSGTAYYQVQQGITVRGNDCSSNQYCIPVTSDPPSKVLPISDANIQDWKTQSAIPSHSGFSDCPSPAVIGPGKYIGDVTIKCNITINDPIWITGNLTLNNNAIAQLNSSYGASSGMIIVDGKISVSNGATIKGSGVSGSYITTLTTYVSSSSNDYAIDLANNSSADILYAGDGTIHFNNLGGSAKEITAKTVVLDPNATVSYQTGLSSVVFSSGPSGSYNIIKGTYQNK